MRDLDIKFMYSSEFDDFVNDFYVPLLKKSVYYDRAVGYFSSSMFKDIREGIKELINKNGHIRVVCSPNLTEEDIKKITEGYDRKSIIENRLFFEVSNSELKYLEDIAWLISNDFLDLKVAISKNNKIGLYHEKFGIFFDGQDSVVFWGSSNETSNALHENYESFTTMNSWQHGEEIENFRMKFERLWSNSNKQLIVYDFPEAVKNEIIRNYKPGVFAPGGVDEPKPPVDPPTMLWEHQKRAIKSFFENDYKIIYEMATGTGKTRTALETIKEIYEIDPNVLPIVLVNQSDLLEQWKNNVIKEFGSYPLCISSKYNYFEELNDLIINKRLGNDDLKIVIAIDKSFISVENIKIIEKISAQRIFFIYDEVHNLTPNIYKYLEKNDYKYKLGLTATLERNDKLEEDAIRSFFGDKSFVFSIEDAINIGVLTKYYYNMEFVEMTEEEYILFDDLTKKIGYIYNNDDITEQEKQEKISIYAQKRSLVIKKMSNKIKRVVDVISDKPEVNNTVIYCGAGINDEGTRLIDEISTNIKKKDKKNLKISHFTYNEGDQRVDILDLFKEGYYELLLAIKCFDEGIDVPQLQNLYILSSDKSIRQTVQRRGRVMRNFNKKTECFITDFIAIPPKEFSFDKRVLDHEIERILEYNSIAINKNENLKFISKIYTLDEKQKGDLKYEG